MPLNPINVGSAPNDNTGDTLRDAFIKVNSNCTYLDGKAPNAHTHPLSDITQSGAAVGNVPVWNGTAWTPQAGGGALADGDKGDIIVSNVGATWTIKDNAVTGNKIAASTISSSKLGSDITNSGKALLVAADVAAQRTSLGLGTAAIVNVPAAGDASATEAVIGSDTRLSNSRTPSSHVHGNISNAGAIGSAANLPLITGESGVVTTGTFGTAANTFCQGNDSRLSDPRTPISHTHGNITNAGAIGSTANLPLITTTSGVVTTGAFGTEANTFCVGNDSRLSDSRTPTAHTHAASDITSGTFEIGLIPTGSTATTVCIGNDARLSNARTPTAHTHALSDLTQSSATTGQVIAWNGTAWAPASATAGSVTSVGLALPNIFTVSNSPVTGSGTLTGVLATQAAATVFAGPTTGADAAPTFRALVAGDIPALSYEASGSISTHAALTNGVHGITTWAAGLVSQIMASGARGYLGLGSAAVANTGDFDAAGAAASAVSTHAALASGVHGISTFIGNNFLSSNSAPAARTNLGLGTSATRDEAYFALASHTHGNITNVGAIGSTANLPLITTTSGVVTTGTFGTGANTFCQGDDARLSDPRTPLAHTHAVGDLTQSGATSGQVIGWNGTAWAPTTVTSGSGGNISGPNSGITDNAIVRWDTNNTTIQNSVVTISDVGEFVGANSVAFSTSPSGSSAIGKVIWDTTNKTLSLGIGAGSVAALLGVDSHILVRNTTGSQINKGQVVRVNGASSGNMTVALAQGNNDANTTTTIGVAAENIANSGTGMVVTTGLLGGLDTSTWAAGDMLFISHTTPGLLVNAAPAAPNHAVRMGYVVSSNPNSGIIYVNVDNGYELDELHDVAYPTAVANNHFLVYTTNRWENKTPADARTALGLGTLATQSGTFSGTSSGTNTGDQTISLTGDVTGSGTGTFSATIASQAVTYAKIQNVSATDKLLGRSSANAGSIEEIACTAAGRALLDDADAAAQRTTLGLGTAATSNTTAFAAAVHTHAWSDITSGKPTTLSGYGITDAQPFDDELTAIAALTVTSNQLPYFTAAGSAALLSFGLSTRNALSNLSGTNTGDQTITLTGDVTGTGTGSFAATIAAGSVSTSKLGGDITTAGKALLDDADAAAQRTTLGLGTLATQSGTFSGTSSGTNTGDQTITLTGDVTGSGTGSFTATIAAGAVGTSKLGGDITTAGKALLDDADAAAQRTTLGLGSVATLSSVSLASNVTGTLPIANGGTGQTTATSAFNSLAPGTTKGDLIVHDGTNEVRLAVGATNGHVLTIDSSTATGLKWSAASGGGGGGGSTNVWIPAAQWIPTSSSGCGINSLETATNKVNYDVLEFDAGSLEYAEAIIVMPSNYNGGTVTAKFHWTAASGSGNVIFALAGRSFGDNSALDQAFGTAQSATDTLQTASSVHISPATAAITLAGTVTAGNSVVFLLSRDATNASDTLGVDARFLGVEISYTSV